MTNTINQIKNNGTTITYLVDRIALSTSDQEPIYLVNLYLFVALIIKVYSRFSKGDYHV